MQFEAHTRSGSGGIGSSACTFDIMKAAQCSAADCQRGLERGCTCSIPNQGSSFITFSIASMHANLVLVGMGFMSTCLPSMSRGGS